MRRLRESGSRNKKGFALVELLIALGIVAAVSIGVLLALNPNELLKQSRDSKRIAELTTLSKTVQLYTSLSDRSSIGMKFVDYISVPDPAATSSLGNQCQSLGLPQLPIGWTYHCASPSFYRNIDGTGWVPVDFSAIPSGLPFSALAVDPANTTSTGLYYTYTTDGILNYEFTAAVESQRYGKGGSNDVVSKDGGQFDNLYETGWNLFLAPANYATGTASSQQSAYTFGGFLSPIQPNGAGIYQLGRTLPIKFRLTDANGSYTTAPTAHLFVTNVQNGIVGTTPITLTNSDNDEGGLFKAGNNQYSYNLQTDAVGYGTWQIKAVLSDGSSYTEIISLEN